MFYIFIKIRKSYFNVVKLHYLVSVTFKWVNIIVLIIAVILQLDNFKGKDAKKEKTCYI